MIYADQFIENNSIFLRNLNKNATNADWSTASGSYGFYPVPYEQPLAYDHYYYQRFTYKFSTTNQKPTWVQFYRQGGFAGGASSGTISGGLTAGTEYTYSAIVQPEINYPAITLINGTIYQGPSGAIAGVSGQAKEIIMYDVTELFDILVANGLVAKDSTAALKTWCDNNLVFQIYGVNYDITSLVAEATSKVFIKKGIEIQNEIIEADGMEAFSVSTSLRNNTYFDTGSGVGVYNNKGGGTVTHTRVDAKAQNSPFAGIHPYVLQITTNGTASPGAGGFIASHSSAANKIFVEKFVAKIPTGYTVAPAYNSQGTGASVTMISNNKGTGDWEEYTILYKCGTEGSFSSGGHVYISGSNNTSVTWYLAYVNNCEITGKEYLKNFTVMKNNDRINNGKVFSREFNECNIFPNGDFSDASWTLPTNWTWDDTDYAGNATRSLVQGVNGGAFTVGPKLAVDPTAKYKVSYWIKCKQDMTSFLTAIRVFIGNTEVVHGNVMYDNGTKTQLAAVLNTGDTSMTVKSAANWTVRSYSKLGFRSNNRKSWNDLGASNGNGTNGLISAVDTNTKVISFSTPYTGATRAVNTWVVESYDGNIWPYPIGKGNLPTDNTWKYVEGYFGGENVCWDGRSPSWSALPHETTHIQLYLNIYGNTGTVPIKYSDIRIEQVSPSAGHRYENKIQFKEVN